MPKVAIRDESQARPCPPPPGAQGDVRSSAYFEGEKHPIHLRLHRLGPGARLAIHAEGPDLSLFVWQGSGKAGSTAMETRSSAVVRNRARFDFEAGQDGAALLEFAIRDGLAEPDGAPRLYLLPAGQVPRKHDMGGEGIGGGLHADAHDPTPNVWLHENDFPMPDKLTILHSHSEDEVIFVRTGAMRLGNRLFGPGTAIAIAAHTLYEFRSGPEGLGFVNFRGVSPTYTAADGSLVLDEADIWEKAVGRPVFVEA